MSRTRQLSYTLRLPLLALLAVAIVVGTAGCEQVVGGAPGGGGRTGGLNTGGFVDPAWGGAGGWGGWDTGGSWSYTGVFGHVGGDGDCVYFLDGDSSYIGGGC